MHLDIPNRSFAAYLFDCDGTIADSLPLHYQAWIKALSPWACPFPEDLFYAWGGIPVPKTVEMLNERFLLNMPIQAVSEAREKAYFALLPQIKPHAAVVAQIHAQFGKIPLAVVSGSPRASIERTLNVLGLWDRFQLIVGAEDTARGKPCPDPYLKAAQGLGVCPEDCLVFEDAEPGVQAAIAAGMSYVRVPQR
jgi:HAD superfamily hydrolase (TIGR01509 family)